MTESQATTIYMQELNNEDVDNKSEIPANTEQKAQMDSYKGIIQGLECQQKQYIDSNDNKDQIIKQQEEKLKYKNEIITKLNEQLHSQQGGQ